MKLPIAVVSISGGKDSQETANLAIDRYGRENVRLCHADTGHEHELTERFVREDLPEMLGLPVEIVRADFTLDMARKREFIAARWFDDLVAGRDGRWRWIGEGDPEIPMPEAPSRLDGYWRIGNWKWMPARPALSAAEAREIVDRAIDILQPTGNPFLDLCLMKGRFPSRKAQFCTQELKRRPLDAYLLDLMAQGYEVESWQGVRRDESQQRRDALEWEDAAEGWRIHRPIIEWSAQQVVDAILARGQRLNPLYSMGCNRVGCMLCINAAKNEIANAARRWPEHIDKIRRYEELVKIASKRASGTFFTDANPFNGETNAEFSARMMIDQRVEWAKTSRGGVQYDLEHFLPVSACSSSYGLCE